MIDLKEPELDGLRRKIAIMYDSGVNSSELGNIALEIILKRNDARDDLEHNPTMDKKIEIQQKIDALHELERAIVSLHVIGTIKSTSRKSFDLANFTKTHYTMFNKKIMP